MTVKQLIKKLQRLPQNAEVGFACHDNSEFELQGWVFSVNLVLKEDSEGRSPNELEQIDSMPEQWVSLRN